MSSVTQMSNPTTDITEKQAILSLKTVQHINLVDLDDNLDLREVFGSGGWEIIRS